LHEHAVEVSIFPFSTDFHCDVSTGYFPSDRDISITWRTEKPGATFLGENVAWSNSFDRREAKGGKQGARSLLARKGQDGFPEAPV
jgi:hypothetical protein